MSDRSRHYHNDQHSDNRFARSGSSSSSGPIEQGGAQNHGIPNGSASGNLRRNACGNQGNLGHHDSSRDFGGQGSARSQSSRTQRVPIDASVAGEATHVRSSRMQRDRHAHVSGDCHGGHDNGRSPRARKAACRNAAGRSASGRNAAGHSASGRSAADHNDVSGRIGGVHDASSRRSSSTHGHSTKASGKKKGRIVKRVVLTLLALVLFAGIGAAVYINMISGNLHKDLTQEVRDALVKTEYSKEPFYMLLLGTDESQERAAEEEYGGSFRSDSMMLVRIDCPNKKVTLVSLERDTLLDMGDAGWQKLNAASALGGPAYAIETVSKMAHDTPISHYALIDFDGFCDVVDALGGIEVDVPVEINDDDAGGYLAAGQQTLNGQQALILCRSRHTYEEYGSGNTYRSANQRLVLSAIAQKILASDVATIASTVGTLSKYLSTDLGVNDIIGIAQALRGLDMKSDMYTAMQPTTSLYEDGVWYNTSDEPEWQEMLERVDQGLPPTETDEVDATGTVLASTGSGQTLGGSKANSYLNKKSGTVVVRNGGAPTGSGGKAGEIIEAMGYTTDIANANSSDYEQTIIVYQSSDKRADAMEIAQALGIGRAVKNEGEYLMDGDFLVVLGSDYGAQES